MQTIIRLRKPYVILTLFSFWVASVVYPQVSLAQGVVEIPAGTAVRCTFNEAVNPETAPVGQRLTLSVSEAVVVDGVTVIQVGAPVIAEVTQSQKRGSVGKPAIIGVTLYSVTATDGSSIALSGQKVIQGESKQTSALVITILCCILGLLQKGGDAVIPEGSSVVGTIPGTTKINR